MNKDQTQWVKIWENRGGKSGYRKNKFHKFYVNYIFNKTHHENPGTSK